MLHETQNELLFHHKRSYICIIFDCGRIKTKFRFAGGQRETAHSIKVIRFCINEINAYRDVSFHMISFQVVFA